MKKENYITSYNLHKTLRHYIKSTLSHDKVCTLLKSINSEKVLTSIKNIY